MFIISVFQVNNRLQPRVVGNLPLMKFLRKHINLYSPSFEAITLVYVAKADKKILKILLKNVLERERERNR